MNGSVSIRTFVGVVVAFFALCLFGLNYFGVYQLGETAGFFRAYSAALTATSTIVALLLWRFWKFPLLRGWLILVPNLNGTWEGTLSSDWIDPETNERIGQINTILVIKQSLFGMSCVAKTGEMTSYSISAGFESDKNDHVHRLVYTYRSEPRPGVSVRSAIHHGSAVLEFGKKPEWVLAGRYFTERKTTGEIHLTFRDRQTDTQLSPSEKVHPMDQGSNEISG